MVVPVKALGSVPPILSGLVIQIVGGKCLPGQYVPAMPVSYTHLDVYKRQLISIEKGTPTVSIGSYAAVLHALNNMDSDLLLIAKDDEFGRKLQDLALPTRRRAPKKGE